MTQDPDTAGHLDSQQHSDSEKRVITVLGATGSIGKSTLDVISRHPEKYSVYALSAQSRVNELFEQCVKFQPEVAVIGTESGAEQLTAEATSLSASGP